MLRVVRYLSKRGYAAAANAAAANPTPVEAGQLRLTFACPDKAFFNLAVVKQVDVPTLAGYVGVLANHVPTIGVLKPGVVQVYEDEGNISKYFVSSGTLSVNIDGTVQVLAEEALKVEDIDQAAAQKLLEEGQRKTLDSSANEVERAEAQIRAEVADALIKAATGQQ